MINEKTNETDIMEYEVKVIRSIEEVEELRSAWKKMQWHPNADIDLYVLNATLRNEISEPCVFTLNRKQIPVVILAGRIEDERIEYRIGYKTIFNPKVRQLSFVYGGFMGERSNVHVGLLIAEVIALLKRGEADVVYFNSLRGDWDICQLIRTKSGMFCRDSLPNNNVHWAITMPKNIEDLLARFKSKHRSELRRTFRYLKKEYADKVEIKCLHDIDDVEQICVDAEDIMKNTYQRAIQVGFMNNVEHQKRVLLSASKGWLRAYILYVDKKPGALWIGSLYEDTFFLEYTGFDPKYQKYEPGTLLLLYVIEDLCNSKFTEIDFGFGDALYKQRFGNKQWIESSVYMYAPTIKGIALNLLRCITIIPYRYIRQLAERNNILQKIKRFWRNKLVEGQRNTDAGI